jgi:hypothetical protein
MNQRNKATMVVRIDRQESFVEENGLWHPFGRKERLGDMPRHIDVSQGTALPRGLLPPNGSLRASPRAPQMKGRGHGR